jgi:hypothetical protein
MVRNSIRSPCETETQPRKCEPGRGTDRQGSDRAGLERESKLHHHQLSALPVLSIDSLYENSSDWTCVPAMFRHSGTAMHKRGSSCALFIPCSAVERDAEHCYPKRTKAPRFREALRTRPEKGVARAVTLPSRENFSL